MKSFLVIVLFLLGCVASDYVDVEFDDLIRNPEGYADRDIVVEGNYIYGSYIFEDEVALKQNDFSRAIFFKTKAMNPFFNECMRGRVKIVGRFERVKRGSNDFVVSRLVSVYSIDKGVECFGIIGQMN